VAKTDFAFDSHSSEGGTEENAARCAALPVPMRGIAAVRERNGGHQSMGGTQRGSVLLPHRRMHIRRLPLSGAFCVSRFSRGRGVSEICLAHPTGRSQTTAGLCPSVPSACMHMYIRRKGALPCEHAPHVCDGADGMGSPRSRLVSSRLLSSSLSAPLWNSPCERGPAGVESCIDGLRTTATGSARGKKVCPYVRRSLDS
jgi:hypothetical protein